MPTLCYRIEAPGVNILKTVTDEVVAGLLSELDLTRSFTDAIYTMSSFMAASQFSNSEGVPTLDGKNRCDVEVGYIMDKLQVPWPVETPYTTTAYGINKNQIGHHTPILIDSAAGILIEHYTSACALDMNFVLTFATFDEATKAFDTIRSKYAGSLIQTPFDLSFAYPVSASLFQYLTAVFQAKTDYQSKTILDYINDMKKTEISFNVRKSQLTDLNADTELMVRCQQLNCLGLLTMEQKEPDVTRVNELPSTYSISFNFQVQFGRPFMVAVNTPVSIDNTLLPPTLFSSITTNYHYNPGSVGVFQDLVCNDFMRKSYGNYANAAQIIRLPAYDDWFSVDRLYAFYEYRPFLIAHFTLDGPVTTIDLKQLDDVVLHPVVQTIMKEMGNLVFEYGGLFNIGVYADNLRLGQTLVSLSDDLILTITSNRNDKVYHLMLSETTNLDKMSVDWNPTLIKYRYFFPLTIERGLQSLIKKRVLYIAYDDSLLSLISRLWTTGRLKALLETMIELGEDTYEIYGYTQNPSQLADYLAYSQSLRTDYVLPTGTDATSLLINQYYTDKASIEGRSLLVAFLEQCLIAGYTDLDSIPTQYLEPSRTMFPYYSGQGGFYGFNTPLRVLSYTITPQRPA